MSPEDKISPAFEPYLSDSKRGDKHEAVVIYEAPQVEGKSGRRRSHRAQQRIRKAQSAAHREVECRIIDNYLQTSSDDVTATPIGGSALPAITVEITPTSLLSLAQQPDVLAILPNQKIHLIQPESVAYDELARQEARFGKTWGLEQLDIPRLWEITKGENINVGVLDTGVYGDHPVLRGRISGFVMIDPLGRRINSAPMFDAHAHGTHVCGTIVGGETPEGVTIGVAPCANILMAAVLVGDTTIRTLLEGLDWAIEKGADIVNMSLGFNYYEPLFAQVFDILINQYDVLPVVAVGNENQGNSSSPGNIHNALAVGAVEKLQRSRVDVAFFSSGASLVFPGQEPNDVVTKPDVVAPGVQVYSSIPPILRADGAYLYSYMDGTSMATPHVSGVAALLMAKYPYAPVMDIVQAIKETAIHPGGNKCRPDNRWGYGLVDAKEALRALA